MRGLAFARSGTRHVLAVAVEALLVVAIVATLLVAFAPTSELARSLAGAGVAAAGKPGSGAMLACRVTPDPVAAGSIYTITGSKYPTGRQLLINVVNDAGTLVLFTGAASDGSIAVDAYATSAGNHTVRVFDNSRRRAALIGSCGFTAN
jgi:hypothetical protein